MTLVADWMVMGYALAHTASNANIIAAERLLLLSLFL
jgi:hypothetical protein